MRDLFSSSSWTINHSWGTLSVHINLCSSDSKYLSRCWPPNLFGPFYIIVNELHFSKSNWGEQTHCFITFCSCKPWPRSTTANVLLLLQQQILSLVCNDCLLNTKEWPSEQRIAVFCLHDIQRYRSCHEGTLNLQAFTFRNETKVKLKTFTIILYM